MNTDRLAEQRLRRLNPPLGTGSAESVKVYTVDYDASDDHARCRDETRLARDLAGHRVRDAHDCFLMNCRDLGDEVRINVDRLGKAMWGALSYKGVLRVHADGWKELNDIATDTADEYARLGEEG